MTTVLWLGETGCDDSATVGGKVANLSRLAAAYPVPDGFCVPVTAFGDCASSALPAPLAARIADAYRRLGESIVGGTVTPDTYIVRKRDGAIAEQRIAEKRRMTVAVPGGTQEVDVPRFLRAQPALNERQIAAMTDLARGLEQTMGWPVDIECACHGDRLFLLQCRPSTTLTTGQPSSALVLQGARAGTAVVGGQ